MRITEVEVHEFTYRVEDVGVRNGNRVYEPGAVHEPPGFVLTIRTADGTEGYYRGFAFTPPAVAQIRMMADTLVGRNPLEREDIWIDLWRRLRHTDHLGLGPIDVALWDLAGRHYDESVGALLGGSGGETPAYASTYFVDDAPDGLSSPEAFVAYAEDCLDEGYPGYKIHAHPEGDPDVDVAICRALAEAVGDEMDLMLDVASLYSTYADTLRVGRVMDELDFFWYEDPLMETGQSASMARRLVRELDTPILGLEHVRSGPFGSVDHIVDEALDLVRTSAHLDAGITGVMKTASAAEALGADVELHLGGPAHFHCLSAIRNASYFEHALLHPTAGSIGDQGYAEPVQVVENGAVTAPDGPGLGAEIDWDFVEDRLTNHEIVATN